MYLRAGRPVRGRGRADYYEGFSNDTLWPIYHDVIVPATFHRRWCDAYRDVNRRFAEAVAKVAARGAHGLGARLPAAAGAGHGARRCARTCGSAGSTTSRSRRSSCSPSCPGGARWSRGCSAPTSSASSAPPTPQNFLRVCRRLLGLTTKGDTVVFTPHGSGAEERTGPRERHPDLGRLPGPGRARPQPGGHRPGQGDPRVAGQPRVLHARGRPARLHQGHPAPAQGLRGAARTTARSRRRTRCWCRSRRRAASASRPTASCARRSRRRSGGSTASTPTSGRRPCSTSTTATAGRRWRPCSSRPTSCWSPRCATA